MISLLWECVLQFLSNRNYPTSVSLKMLKLPSTRLILEIFEVSGTEFKKL